MLAFITYIFFSNLFAFNALATAVLLTFIALAASVKLIYSVSILVLIFLIIKSYA